MFAGLQTYAVKPNFGATCRAFFSPAKVYRVDLPCVLVEALLQ
jgi:hypothetical protein